MLKLTKHQYASLVRSLEKTLQSLKNHGEQKGGGPDDYGFPKEMETYLYRHPMCNTMSMLEFFVDDNGVRGGGFKTSIGKTLRREPAVDTHFGRLNMHLDDSALTVTQSVKLTLVNSSAAQQRQQPPLPITAAEVAQRDAAWAAQWRGHGIKIPQSRLQWEQAHPERVQQRQRRSGAPPTEISQN